ncbi:MAG: hypothetical protein LBH32_12510 [Dysgonamonadaceae bacterium]|jgi:hypothetical protein|nr:hypothetical protein [Dysgonamonadaceae bacterium]
MGFLIIMLLSLIFYVILVYQINYLWDSIENIMSYSCKRYIFCFVPLAWFYIASSKPVCGIFNWLTKSKA